MSAEDKYQEIVKELDARIQKSVTEACERVHSEIVPYINDDTESNARFRAVDIVRKIIRGEFDVDGSRIKVDGWVVDSLTDNDYDRVVDALAARAGDQAKDMKIARLERLLSEAMNKNHY